MSSVYAEQKEGVSIVNIDGRMDTSTATQIQERIMDEIEKGSKSIVINFSKVDYISSEGLRVLIYASKIMSEKSGSFSICSIDKNIEKILEISGLKSIFKIYENVDESVKAASKLIN